MRGELGDVGGDEKIEKVAHIDVGRVDVLDPVRAEVLDGQERHREWDEQYGRGAKAPRGVSQVRCNGSPVEGAEDQHCDGSRDRL